MWCLNLFQGMDMLGYDEYEDSMKCAVNVSPFWVEILWFDAFG